MGGQTFRFQQFTVCQDRCAMKVGTDGVLLGAWAEASNLPAPRMLDIGAGTGLVALMMAQRFAEGRVVAIDIDPAAAQQASENFAASPFAHRLEARCVALQDFEADEASFDVITCNPPYYVDALKCPDGQRNLARHADALPFADLMRTSSKLLAQGGRFSLVLPFDALQALEAEAIFAGLVMSRLYLVRTKAAKPPKRVLVEFTNMYGGAVEKGEFVIGDDMHNKLIRSFLLPKYL